MHNKSSFKMVLVIVKDIEGIDSILKIDLINNKAIIELYINTTTSSYLFILQ
jgi:hypothetical protein